MRWNKVSRDDYVSDDGRFEIVRLPAERNTYGKIDEWTLACDGQGVDVFTRLQDAKAEAENL